MVRLAGNSNLVLPDSDARGSFWRAIFYPGAIPFASALVCQEGFLDLRFLSCLVF